MFSRFDIAAGPAWDIRLSAFRACAIDSPVGPLLERIDSAGLAFFKYAHFECLLNELRKTSAIEMLYSRQSY